MEIGPDATRATLAVATMEELDCNAAVTFTWMIPLATFGAVYRPALLIVPKFEFPPETPLTDQLTGAPPDAVNCCVLNTETRAELGDTEMVVGRGGVGFETGAPLPQPAQAIRSRLRIEMKALCLALLAPAIWALDLRRGD